MTQRENWRRAIRFKGPDWVPVRMSINPSCFNHYEPGVLENLIKAHKRLFPDYREGIRPPGTADLPLWQKAGSYTDPWGCIWKNVEDGLTGAVVHHPLENLEKLKDYRSPDPEKTRGMGPEGSLDWTEEARNIRKMQSLGLWAGSGLHHGHTFLRLCNIRGYENVIFDMVDGRPELEKLISIIEDFNLHVVKRSVETGADQIAYAEDLGMQKGPMLSPAHFRKYIKPSYKRLIAPAKKENKIIHMHSDGDIRELAEDLLDIGIESLNLQDLVNGIDWIKDNLKGRVCIDLDIDRQKVTLSGSPGDVDDLIREEVEKLGSPTGGLTMKAGIYPGIPVQNLDVLMTAMEKYSLLN